MPNKNQHSQVKSDNPGYSAFGGGHSDLNKVSSHKGQKADQAANTARFAKLKPSRNEWAGRSAVQAANRQLTKPSN